jgi:hypothetical protein
VELSQFESSVLTLESLHSGKFLAPFDSGSSWQVGCAIVRRVLQIPVANHGRNTVPVEAYKRHRCLQERSIYPADHFQLSTR